MMVSWSSRNKYPVTCDNGIELNNGVSRLRAEASNFPLEVLLPGDDDVPQYMADEVADIGIAGENVGLEKARLVDTADRLGFGKCRLSIALPRHVEYQGIQSLQHKKSYPKLLQQFLDDLGYRQSWLLKRRTMTGSAMKQQISFSITSRYYKPGV